MATHNPEHSSGAIEEIFFDTLQTGDVLVIDTASGSSYRLTVEDVEGKPRVAVERSSDHAVRDGAGTSWQQHSDNLFELRGMCKRTFLADNIPVPIDEQVEGSFVVGERAWLGLPLGDTDNILITSPIQTLQLIPAQQ
ncbi:MAG: hypothetical protein JWL89_632 [Candidatus Saccharibacteria bacterium]|nr:hypothetical protein [Candidatus Saccharibacteria bacterium]